jgi:predicted amidophosphoribosyltransferase
VAAPSGHGFCPNCGAQHELVAHYCEACGQPFAAAFDELHHEV